MSMTQCRRCGGQISSNSTSCPWCGHATTFNLVGPLLLVILIGTGIGFGLGLIRWQWLEQTLGLDRGFIDPVATADGSGGGGGGTGGDLTWRLPPGPDPANDYHGAGAAGGRGGTPRAAPSGAPAAPQARVATVTRASRSAPSSSGSLGCADSSAIGRLVSRYPKWADSDLGLIACGNVRTGFSGDQVRASLGKPVRVTRDGPAREKWQYDGITVLVEQGRVISVGQ